MYFPSIGGIAADYSIHDTSKAKILFAPMPGVSAVYPTYEDPYPTVTADNDVYNLRLSQPAGTALRPRNPCDSMYLLFYIPTVHYRNIVLKYASETSSLGHGPAHQVFDYSIDSGATWRTSGLSEPMDSADVAFKLITVSFTSDSAVNNNAKLVFRITFNGNTTGTSGNNRFDNVTVEGDSIYAVSSITTTPAAYGPFCNTSTSTLSVPFTSTGTYTGGYSVQLSNPDGSFPTTSPVILGSGLTSPIFAAISSGVTPGTHYRVRVINSAPLTYGSDNGTDIAINAPPTAYGVTGGGSYCGGGTGVNVGLTNSQSGVSYQLYLTGVATGSPVTGIGTPMTLGSETTAGSYTVKGSYSGTPGCVTTMTGSVTVSVNPAPAMITGTTNVCTGFTTTLHDVTTPGTWSKSNANVNIGSTTGMVTGVTAGTSVITYTGTGGCYVTTTVNVSTAAAITGTMAICNFASTTLADATGAGTWSSSNTNASIGATSGNMTGANVGTSVITYTSTAGCSAYATVTINAQPSAISGPTALCATSTISLTNTVTGGVWTSATPATATVGSSSGIVSGVATGTTVITYTATGGCYANTTVTVSLSPGPISGSPTVCAGTTTGLSDGVGGGLWTSSSANATIGSLSGTVTGVAAGTATITYSLGGTSCTVTKPITVNPSPAHITGIANICAGTTTPLGDITTGGTWSSGATGVATVSGSGIVSGSTTGTAPISYTAAGCPSIYIVTVNPIPAAIGGLPSVCSGSSITLTESVSGGTWSSTSSAISLGSLSGNVTGLSAGPATITYSLGICPVYKTISVNPVPSLTGPSGVCVGSNIALAPSITGGTWTSSATAMATVSSAGSVHGVSPGSTVITYNLPTGCSATMTVTVNTIPTAITGIPAVCVNATTALGDGAGGGVWSIAPTTNATISASTGVVAGVTAGPAIVTYSLGTGCTVTAPITVNPLPLSVTGTLQACEGLTTSVHDATTAGIWSSSTPSLATVDASSGLVSAATAGVDTISYTISTGCTSFALLTVNPLPPAITIAGYVCIGLNTHFNDAVSGGKWTTATPAFATVDSLTGIVTGVSSSTPVITYTLPTGCITTIMATVNAVAPTISGTPIVCQGLMTTLSDSLAGGAWSSSDNSIASVGAGIVTGVSAGTAVISYTHGGICPAAVTVTVNPLPLAIAGVSHLCPYTTTPFTDAGTGSWSSSTPSIASVDASSGVVSGVYPGVAIITYTLPTGCIASTHVTIDPIPSPIIGTFNVCDGYTTSLTDAARGTWSSSATAVATVGTSGIVSGISGGTSVISYTVSTGCAATALFTVISVPPVPGLGSVCAWGDTVDIHEPYSPGTFTSTSVTVLNLGGGNGKVTTFAPGTATITYTTSTGCFATTTFTVNSLPGVISGRERFCNGLTTLLNDTAAGGTWTSGDLSIATAGSVSGIITGVSTGAAHITYTLPSGCSSTTMVTVTPTPSMITGANEICPGTTTPFTDSITGGIWSSNIMTIATVGGATGIVNGISAGSTTITYSFDPSCYVTKTISIDPAPAAYSITGGGSYCADGIGEDIGLGSSQAGTSYQLYYGSSPIGIPLPGAGTPLNFGLQTAAGTYSVMATNTTTGCIAYMSGAATININPLPAVFNVTGGGTFCTGYDGVHIGLDNSAGGFTYQLYLAGAAVGASRFGIGSALDFGLHVAPGAYTIVATNNTTLCAANMAGTAVVTPVSLETPGVSVAATPGNVVCAGTPVTFNASPVNGGTAPVYHWMVNGSTVSSTASSYSYTPANGDRVAATLTSSDACAFPATASDLVAMTVNTIVAPTVTIAANPGTTITTGTAITLTASATGIGLTYQWEQNGITITGATNATYLATGITNGDTYTCIVTGSGACSSSGSNTVTITVNPVDHTGVGQVTTGNKFSVFPNPGKGVFTVKGHTAAGVDEEIAIEITDILGQKVFSNKTTAQNGAINETISAGTLANGMYLLTIRTANEYSTVHVVIEH